MAKETASDKEIGRLRTELADVKAGTQYHFHLPRDGSPSFRCTSPYCEDLGTNAPVGPPPNYEIGGAAERYARRDDA